LRAAIIGLQHALVAFVTILIVPTRLASVGRFEVACQCPQCRLPVRYYPYGPIYLPQARAAQHTHTHLRETHTLICYVHCMYVCIRLSVCTHTYYVYTYYVYVYIYMGRQGIRTYINPMYTYTYICMCVCMCSYVCVCAYTWAGTGRALHQNLRHHCHGVGLSFADQPPVNHTSTHSRGNSRTCT